MSDSNVVCDSYDVVNQSSTTETNCIPKGSSATTYTPLRLGGIFIRPNSNGSWNDDRVITLKDKKTDAVLLQIFVSQLSGGYSGGLNLKIPGSGIRCPNGVKFDTVKTYHDYVGVFYE